MTNESPNHLSEKYKLPDDHFARLKIHTVEAALEEVAKAERMPKRKTVMADRDKLNAKVLELVAMYNEGNNIDYAIGGLETLSEVFGVDLLRKYGINR
jgi:hypothetical protein